jgi:hypothetical protein
MSGQDLFNELQEKTTLLDQALSQLGKRGREYANAHAAYRMELSKEILLERDKSTPVTIISDVCRGKTKIANLCMKRDIAEAMYKAAMEAINVYKLEVNILREQIDREWHRE